MEQDLQAITILDHIINSTEAETTMLKHCTSFLHASMVKFYKSDITVEVDHTAVMTQPLMQAKEWASTKFQSVVLITLKIQDNLQKAHHSKP
eukprot:4545161-Ditylum_brightwellii.AAC.1